MITDKHIKLIETAHQYIGTHHDEMGDDLITGWLANVRCSLKTNGTYTPYCAGFVISMLKEAGFENKVFQSASSLAIWNKTPKELRVSKAYKGCLFVWDFGGGRGHIGFCDNVLPNDKMTTIEGNTKNPNVKNKDATERDGGWVYSKERTNKIAKIGAINILGFIDPYL
jgi:hypothetical protein